MTVRMARLYDRPDQFSDFVVRQLRETMGVEVRKVEGESLLIEICRRRGNREAKWQINLLEVYHSYMMDGDLNAAIDFMNGIWNSMRWLRQQENMMFKLHPAHIYPAVRDEQYIRELEQESPVLSEPYLPGLRVVFLDIKDRYVKVINQAILDYNPGFTEVEIKRLAYGNLRSAGWQPPVMVLPSPTLPSCSIEVYCDPAHPVACQFLLPELSWAYLPSQYVIAYPNRSYTLLMRSVEQMETKEQAKRLVAQSRFADVVKRSVREVPFPISDQLFWVCDGKVERLD